MEKFKIIKPKRNNDTITRTIRMNGTTFDKITDLADKHEVSFNYLVNQLIEYGLSNIEDTSENRKELKV